MDERNDILTPEEEKLRIELMKHHNTKVNQHVAYLISFLIGISTYISRIKDIVDFLLTYKFTLVSSTFLSLFPLAYFSIIFPYLLGRTFYWNFLLNITMSFNFNAEYKEARNEASDFLSSDGRVSQSNNLWRFYVLVIRSFTKLKGTLKWKLAYRCRNDKILVPFLGVLSAFWIGVFLGLISLSIWLNIGHISRALAHMLFNL